MKIIYLHQYFSNLDMPGGTRSFEMGRRLALAGHEIHLVTSLRQPVGRTRGWQKTEEEGMQVHWLANPYSNNMGYKRRILSFLRFAWFASKKAADLGGDLIFASSTPLTIVLPGIYASRKNRIPMVFEVRDLWPEIPIAVGGLKNPLSKKAALRLEKMAYRNSSRVIALSPGIKEGVIEKGYPPERIHVIPNGADLDLFNVSPEEGARFREKNLWLGDRPLIVYTGTLGKINGIHYLVRLAEAVSEKAPEVCFLVIGDGAEKEKIRKEAQRAGILDRSFFLLASLPKKEIPSVLSAANLATSLFIDLPAMWSNSANKFFDALASGTPVAINYLGWQAALLDETGAGLVLDARDIHRSARLLLDKLEDQGWLKKAGLAARKLAEERFSRDKLAGELEGVLQQVVAVP